MAKKTNKKTVRKSAAKTSKPSAAVRKNGMLMRRADLGADVGMYFAGLSGWQLSLAKRLDRLVRGEVPSASAAIKWGMPVYEHHGMLCYIRSQAKYMTLGFYGQATGMSDPKGLMEGTGKGMRHVKMRSEAEADEKYLRGLVKQAAMQNLMMKGSAKAK